MARVRAQSAVSAKPKVSKRELYARVCYYYPRYSMREVELLPARDVNLLLKTAMKLEAAKMYNLTAIAAAPHSDKQKNVKKLLKHFESLMKD